MNDRNLVLSQAGELHVRLEQDAQRLNLLLQDELRLEQEHDALAYAKELVEAEHILRETCKDGAINGSNAETRKMQALLFLGRLEEENKVYSQIVAELEDRDQMLQETKMQLRRAADAFSATKAQARLIAAVLTAVSE